MKTEKKFIIVKKNYRNILDTEVPKMVIEIYVFSVNIMSILSGCSFDSDKYRKGVCYSGCVNDNF